MLPLLQLRAVAIAGPASLAESGRIRPEHREAVLNELRQAPVIGRLRNMSAYEATSAASEPPILETSISPALLTDWVPTPGVQQSGDYVSYRLGGDASAGISCLVTFRLPSAGVLVSGAGFIIDMALSLKNPVRLGEVAALFRDGLVLTTVSLPNAIAGVLPQDAGVNQCEVHIAADAQDGSQHQRTNDIPMRVDMSLLGSVGRPANLPITRTGFAARLTAPLTEREAAELVVEAIETMAIDNGYLDTRVGIASLRHELGLLE